MYSQKKKILKKIKTRVENVSCQPDPAFPLHLLLLLLLLLLLQVKPEITIYNYISYKKVDIRQRNKMMAEKGNF